MNFAKPLFWSYQKPNLLSNILLPFTCLIKINNFIINRKKKIKNKRIKSICVGNIYIGGTGKTPTAITLYHLIKEINKAVATAKKFYKSHEDEHIILKKTTNLILGKSRKEIFKKAISNKKKILIFDDGLQDRNVNYDLKFVCFNSSKWIGNGRLIPSGPLREKIDSLIKYDGIFLKDHTKNKNNIIKQIKKINPKIKIFKTYYKPNCLNKIDKKKRYLIFSGVGNPENFKEILKKNKIKVIKEIVFPDHYNYSDNDINKIQKIAKTLDAEIITTEKDYVKIKNSSKKNIKYFKVNLKISNQKKLLNFIKHKLYE